MSVWGNYDKWKTSTPWDNEPDYEVFQTFQGDITYYSCSEDDCEAFDKEVKEFLSDPETIAYDLEERHEVIEDIAEKYQLANDSFDAIQNHIDKETDAREAAREERAAALRERIRGY